MIRTVVIVILVCFLWGLGAHDLILQGRLAEQAVTLRKVCMQVEKMRVAIRQFDKLKLPKIKLEDKNDGTQKEK